MAEKVAVDLLINTAQSAKTVKEIRQAMKDLRNGMLEIGDDGSADFQRLAQATAQLKDQMEDVNDRINAFDPGKMNAFGAATRIAAAGVQLVTSSMALFGDQSQDVQKAMMKVQAAMAFSQAIQGMKELDKEFKTLANTLRANPLIAIATALAALAAAGYAIFKAFQDANLESNKLTKQLDKQKEITSQLIVQYEAQITVMEAQGGQEREIFELKKLMMKQQIADLELSIEIHKTKLREVEDNDSLWESIVRVSGTLAEYTGNQKAADDAQKVLIQNKRERAAEEMKLLQDEQNQIIQLKANVEALEITETKRIENVGKANADAAAKKKEDLEKAAEDEQKILDKIRENELKRREAQDKKEEEEFDKWKQNREAKLQLAVASAQTEEDRIIAQIALLEYQRNEELKNEQLGANEKLLIEQNYLNEINALRQKQSDLEDAQELAKIALRKKVREQDLQVASELFGAMAELSGKNAKAQKAFAAGQTLVDTYLAAQKAYTSQLIVGDPTSPIRGGIAAAAAIISGIARMKKILAVNMDSPSGASAGADSGGAGAGIGALSNTPQIQPTTQLDPNGNVITPQPQQQQPNQVFMVESQARAVHNQVLMFETASRF